VSDMPVNALIEHLVKAEALDVGHFANLLGTEIQQTDSNPYWIFYEFVLAEGLFAEGELRLNAAGDGALLILESRDPPGLGEADLDRVALGPRQGMRPNPHVPPEGIETEFFEINGVAVSIQWTHISRKLTSVILEWTPPSAEEAAPS
jgi:hypothetical protein